MSNLRSLAPSTQNDQSSSSTSMKGSLAGDSGAGGGNSGGTSSGASGAGGAGDGGDVRRKRRNAGNVSLMACTECRHARQRCNGTRPEPCSRCVQRKLVCVYEPHTKTRKDDLIREIETLRGDKINLQDQNTEMAEVATSLQDKNKDLQETSDLQTMILDTISHNGHEQEIVKRLRAGDSYHSIADWLYEQQSISSSMQSLPAPQHSLIDVVKSLERHHASDGLSRRDNPTASDISNQKLIGHLFDLYFTWVHPVHMIFSELEFKHSFQTNDEKYCSSSMVNAICAMACHLLGSEELETLSEELETLSEEVDVSILREGFMAEARNYLVPKLYFRMTTIQTLAIMYLVDLGSGKVRRAMGYLRSAIENMTQYNDDQQSADAREICVWGIEALRISYVGITYQKLHSPDLSRSVVFENVRLDKDDAVWRFYRKVGDNNELPTRPSNAIRTACHQVTLLQIIQESINLYCGVGGKCTAQNLIECYKKYLVWKENLPPVIKSVDVDDEPLPHILYLHVLYHTALVQHFNPLLYCNLMTGKVLRRLQHLVIDHARNGLNILEHSQRLYSSRYQLPLMGFCTVHLGDALIRNSPNAPLTTTVVGFCLKLLQQSRAGFEICGPLQELFRRTAVEFEVDLPDDIDELMEPKKEFDMDDILDAFARLTYAQPLDQILPKIDSSLVDEWDIHWDHFIDNPSENSDKPSTSDRYMQINSLLNG